VLFLEPPIRFLEATMASALSAGLERTVLVEFAQDLWQALLLSTTGAWALRRWVLKFGPGCFLSVGCHLFFPEKNKASHESASIE